MTNKYCMSVHTIPYATVRLNLLFIARLLVPVGRCPVGRYAVVVVDLVWHRLRLLGRMDIVVVAGVITRTKMIITERNLQALGDEKFESSMWEIVRYDTGTVLR